MKELFQHPIRFFAVICVALIAAYIGYMGYRVNETLAGPGWCRTALGAEKASNTEGAIKGLDACVGLLTIQLKSLATNSHILFGVMAGCLLVLVVIVIAGGKVDFAVNKTGVTGTIGKEASVRRAATAAAAATAEAAQDTADDIAAAPPGSFTPPPGGEL